MPDTQSRVVIHPIRPAPLPPLMATMGEISTEDEDVLAIRAGSARVQEVATSLSSRIVAFEGWLNTLPGKVDTKLFHDDMDGKVNWYFVLRFHRSGKRWILSWACDFDGRNEDQEVDFEPLTEASIDVKAYAIRAFPKFLKAIANAQQELVKHLESIHQEYDEFAQKIGVTALELSGR